MKYDVTKYVGEKIREYRKRNKMTQKDLGLKIGVKHNTISGYESGTNEPEQNILFAIADVFGISINDLFPPLDSEVTNLIKLPHEIKPIPVLGSIACGIPKLAEQQIEEYKYEVIENLPHGNLFYLIAKGDSMAPTITSGSYVLIREQPEVQSGEIAAVLLEGDSEATLKRVKWQGDILILISDNKDYPPIIVTKENPARIIGRAVRVSTDL